MQPDASSLTQAPTAAPAVDDDLVAEVAAEADSDTRSVTRRLAGLPVRGRPGVRIDRALQRRGLVLREVG